MSSSGVLLPVHTGDVDVELDLVAVGVEHVEAVGHGVVARAHDRGAGLGHPLQRLAQLVVGVAHLEAEVVQADPPADRERRGVLADLDEEQLVVGAPDGAAKAAAGNPRSGPSGVIIRQPRTSR